MRKRERLFSELFFEARKLSIFDSQLYGLYYHAAPDEFSAIFGVFLPRGDMYMLFINPHFDYRINSELCSTCLGNWKV